MTIKLNDFGLTALAGYKFEETESNFLVKGENLKKNSQLLAVRSVFDEKTQQHMQVELTVVDKKAINFLNRVKSLFGKGPLANLDYDFFTVGKFVEKKVTEIKNKNREIKDFEKISFEDLEKDKILENIYAIANRMKFSHSHTDANLFNLVSKEVAANPRILLGPTTAILKDRIKHNPGMNSRFLAIYLKNQLESEKMNLSVKNFQGIRTSKKLRPQVYSRQAALSDAKYTQTIADYTQGQEIRLLDKIKYEDMTCAIVAFG